MAACDDDATPTTPTPANPVTETFSGTVRASGAAVHNFSTLTGGAVTATLKAIGVDNALVVGFALGNWNTTASTCTIILANDAATGGAVLQGTISNTGALCVRVFDVGNIGASTPAAYSVEVVHP